MIDVFSQLQVLNQALCTAVSKLASLCFLTADAYCIPVRFWKQIFPGGKSVCLETAARCSVKELSVCVTGRTFWSTRPPLGTSTGRKLWTTDTARLRWQRPWLGLALHGGWSFIISVSATNPVPYRRRETRTSQSSRSKLTRLYRTVG